MTDRELVESKIDVIMKNLEYLDEIKNMDVEDFLGSFEKKQAAKHSLQEVIEASLDIANHLISSEGWSRAETYAEMFERLCDNQVIDKSLRDKLADMARFRNLLVHRYGAIDEKRLFVIIMENLEDVHRFIEEIYKYMEGQDL